MLCIQLCLGRSPLRHMEGARCHLRSLKGRVLFTVRLSIELVYWYFKHPGERKVIKLAMAILFSSSAQQLFLSSRMKVICGHSSLFMRLDAYNAVGFLPDIDKRTDLRYDTALSYYRQFQQGGYPASMRCFRNTENLLRRLTHRNRFSRLCIIRCEWWCRKPIEDRLNEFITAFLTY